MLVFPRTKLLRRWNKLTATSQPPVQQVHTLEFQYCRYEIINTINKFDVPPRMRCNVQDALIDLPCKLIGVRPGKIDQVKIRAHMASNETITKTNSRVALILGN